MSPKVVQLVTTAVPTHAMPRPIVRPCEYGLRAAIKSMETQMGSVEAYNKLCESAASLKAKLDAGLGVTQATLWATDPTFIYAAGRD